MSQQSALEYLRHGQTPFFRLPVHDPRAGGYRDVDAVLLGVPFDGGTTYQPGARLAPYHVRRVSALVQTYNPALQIDVFDRLRVVDGGNVAFPPFDREALRDIAQREVAQVVAAGAAPVVLGGDHSVALPALRAVAAKHGPLAVVQVDAHLDTSGPEVWGDAYHHGTPMRHGIAEGLIERGQLYQIGIRGAWGHSEEDGYARGHGAQIYSADTVASTGVASMMEAIRQRIGDRPTYVTFDVDGIDPAYAPGTGTPVPGGLTAREGLGVVRGLAGLKVVGGDVVEVAPSLDHADMTCNLAAYLLFDMLSVIALGRAADAR